jgi:cytochrome c oxidase cbb3-type subunit 4
MPDLGLLRGVITLLTLLTFIGICWWAYRPENRTRFEEDGWLAFDDETSPLVEEPRRVGEPQRVDPIQPVNAMTENASDGAPDSKVEESQA